MPERVPALSTQVPLPATGKVDQICRVTRNAKVLALNAAIEAARACEGFTIISREVGAVSDRIEKLAEELNTQLAAKTSPLKTPALD